MKLFSIIFTCRTSKNINLLSSIAAFLACCSVNAEQSTNGLTLKDLVQRVVDYNQSVQVKALESEISQKLLLAEKGVFEPHIVGGIEHQDNRRPNNTQQLASLGFFSTPYLQERNTIYNGGLEFLSTIGTRLQTGYTMRELDNNLQRGTGPEYETFLGASFVQPLLKNFGKGVTLAKIRLAALSSDISYQEYRRQFLLVIGQAEATYWDLYLSQQQEEIAVDSIGIAEKVLKDNRDRSEVGKSSQLEVLQAEAGVALRKAHQNEARIRFLENQNRLASLFADRTSGTESLHALDTPIVGDAPRNFQDTASTAMESNPDYLIRQKEAEQENVRLVFTKNQRLPQLDLKGSYGLSGLGKTPGDSMDSIGGTDNPSWTIGAELRIPLTGGVKERNEYAAAKLSKQKALLNLKDAETQILNALDSALQKIRTYKDSVDRNRSVVDFHEKLLGSQLERLHVGNLDSRTVLETEERLADAKIAVVESLVLYRKALLELELISGSGLQTRGFEISREQLTVQTQGLIEKLKAN